MKQIVFCLMVLFIAHSYSARAQDSISHNKKNEVRTVPDSVAERMKQEKEFAYANDMSYWKQEEPRKRNGLERFFSALSNSTALKVILYSMLIAAIIYILYQVMVVNNFFIFSRGRKSRLAGDASDDKSMHENLDEKIKEAIDNNNYRQAIRYMYLKTLKVLSDDNVITLHAKSTNQDYIRQMYKHDHLGQFRQLTRIYEYVWYGEFDPTETQFEIIRTNFNRFNQNN